MDASPIAAHPAYPPFLTSLKRTKKLQAMATTEEVEAFNAACQLVGLHPPDTLRKLATAFATQIRERKTVSLPLKVEIK